MLISDKLRGELLRFLVIGGIAVAIDASFYALLAHSGTSSPRWAKRASFGLGAIWAFFMNKYYTFGQKDLRIAEPFVFALLYSIGWALNSACHDLVLVLTGFKSLAFLCATGLSTCTNFIGQKLIVFRKTT